jgi:hypothetical protein
MSAALPFPRDNHRRPNSLIWLGDADPAGRPLHPIIKDLAYKREPELVRYRSKEMKDKAEVASLIEEAVYRTSKAAFETPLSRPGSYLYRTYVNMVDKKLREAVEAFEMESYLLERIVSIDKGNQVEEAAVRRLTRQKVFDSMDDKGRSLWNRHLLGFEVDELAAEEGQNAEYIGKRLRRATQRALRRLLLGGQ